MMRWWIALLLLLNALALAWQFEVFAPWGKHWAPPSAREPERVLNQIRPEAVTVTPAPITPAEPPASAPTPDPASQPTNAVVSPVPAAKP